MKRGKGLVRKTALRAITPLKGKTGLSRGAGLKRTPFAPAKRKPVTSAERAARKGVKKRSGGVCEGCLRREATDYSHRVNEGQGGPWAVVNGLHLCRICHDWLHRNIAAARDLGWSLHSSKDPATEPVWLLAHGLVLLNEDGTITRVTSGDIETVRTTPDPCDVHPNTEESAA